VTSRVHLMLALAAALALALPPTALGAGASIQVSPHKVRAGNVVTVSGSAEGCPVGDYMTLLSQAFHRTHEFAGVPAVFTPVRADGSFDQMVRIPRRRAKGTYSISGRCGGGNLGVTAKLRVLRRR
jgi:hypothetical protein